MPPKYLRNAHSRWSATDDRALRVLADRNTPTRVIGLKLGRSEDAVRSRASQLDVPLKPTHQSPYTPRRGRS